MVDNSRLRLLQNSDRDCLRIHNELKTVGHRVAKTTIAATRTNNAIPPNSDRPTTWQAFRQSLADAISVADFFTVDGWTKRGLVTQYVFFVIQHSESNRLGEDGNVLPNPPTWLCRAKSHMIHPSAVVAVLAVSSLTAQSVGVTLEALAPASIQVMNGTTSNTSTWPTGPMGSYGSFYANLPGGAGGSVSWYSSAQSYATFVSLEHAIGNNGLQPNFACQMGPHELLVEFSSAIPRTATLQLTRLLAVTSGAPAPTVQVDFDNDGVIDINNLSTLPVQPRSVSFGPQPLQVRLIIDAALGAQAGLHNHLFLTVFPDNDLTISTPVSGCAPYSPPPPPFLQQSFDNRGVDILSGHAGGYPSVIVLGWTAQPALLSMHGAMPCLLLPSPNVVIVAPNTLNLPLPASIRPATFFAQGVSLAPSGLHVSDGYSVTAN